MTIPLCHGEKEVCVAMFCVEVLEVCVAMFCSVSLHVWSNWCDDASARKIHIWTQRRLPVTCEWRQAMSFWPRSHRTQSTARATCKPKRQQLNLLPTSRKLLAQNVPWHPVWTGVMFNWKSGRAWFFGTSQLVKRLFEHRQWVVHRPFQTLVFSKMTQNGLVWGSTYELVSPGQVQIAGLGILDRYLRSARPRCSS